MLESGGRQARNRYLDLLRAVAIVRVIVYHLFGWPWLTMAVPAMGVMFALAGSLTAASLDRRRGWPTITSRLRRLLPPLWLLGLVAVPLMLTGGWRAESGGEHPFHLSRLIFWVLPVFAPFGSDRATDLWEPLWYIRAYLWFVLLSPVFYPLYRKLGWITLALPLLVLTVINRPELALPGPASDVLEDMAVFGACWMAGFAHHDGRLRRLPGWVVIPAAAALAAGAVYWLLTHRSGGHDLDLVPNAQAPWSLAFVLIVLRWTPPMDWLTRARPINAAVTSLNQRALTIYLWHNIAIALIWYELSLVSLDDVGRWDPVVDLVTAFGLIFVAVVCFGWAEDLAARRRPHLWPPMPPAAGPAPASTIPAPSSERIFDLALRDRRPAGPHARTVPREREELRP